jgi:DNA-binding NarL/FixJ family response regulator
MSDRPAADLGRLSVLLVDDYPALLSALDESLRVDETLTVIGLANSVSGAIDIASRLKPDVAVIDVNMPGGGGWALVQGLRDAVPEVRLVAYSAFEDALVTRTLGAAGISAYVAKGSDIQVLLAAIHGRQVMPVREEARPLLGRLGGSRGGEIPRPRGADG